MNSLEFINKHIEKTNNQIEYSKRQIIKDAKYDSFVKYYKKRN